jgi:hypothetical protein
VATPINADRSVRIPTAGEVFPDGIGIELLRNPASPGNLLLAKCRNGVVEIAPEVLHENHIYFPISADPSIAHAVRFPTRVAPPESTKKLFADLYALLDRHLAQLDPCITAMVFSIFASWLSPVLPMAPILSIFASAASPSSVALELFALLCRHPLCIAGAKRSDLLHFPVQLKSTLLLDNPNLNLEMRTVLQAGTHRDRYASSSGGLHELFGPKIICTPIPSPARALDAIGLEVALMPVSGQLPILDANSREAIAEEFQARLVGYSLRNSANVQTPDFDVSDLAQPVQAVARSFGAAVVGDNELQVKILPLFRMQDEDIRADRASSLEAVVLETGLYFIHKGGARSVRSDDLAKKVCGIYTGRGSDRKVSPESVGRMIRRLGIPSGRISNAGNGIELTQPTCRLIHQLAESYGVRAMEGSLRSDCRFCRELEMMKSRT